MKLLQGSAAPKQYFQFVLFFVIFILSSMPWHHEKVFFIRLGERIRVILEDFFFFGQFGKMKERIE